jgi:methyltransferase (TIGR00027 family)
VILGAGLDTFAYRGSHPQSLTRVFEVDHPATQAWKRRQLEAAGISIPPTLTLAPVDFERQTLAEGLAEAGFERNAPTFFSWLGVSMYLTGDAIAATLAFVASTAAGGGLVFDYCVPRSSLTFLRRLAFDALARRVAAAGEPFRSFFDPRELTLRLSGLGFRAIQDCGTDELNARYFQNRADSLRVRGGLGRIIVAQT